MSEDFAVARRDLEEKRSLMSNSAKMIHETYGEFRRLAR